MRASHALQSYALQSYALQSYALPEQDDTVTLEDLDPPSRRAPYAIAVPAR